MKNAIALFLVIVIALPSFVLGQDQLAGQAHSKKPIVISQLTAVPYSITTPGSANLLTFLTQDFEGAAFPPNGWTLSGSGSGAWARTTDCSGYGSGVGSVLADFYSISAGTQINLISPIFSAALAGDSVRFDHAYATYQGENDQLQIATSTNGGTAWTTLVTLNGGTSGELVTAPATTNTFVPTASQWATKRFALPVGTNRVRFTGISAYGNELYLDNIVMGTPFLHDVGMASIDAPRPNIAPGSYAPAVSVKNFGTSTESFSVVMNIAPGGYSQTQSVSSLAGGAGTVVSFPNWTPGIGSYTMTVITSMAGELNTSNDTLSQFYIVSDITRGVLLEFATGTWCQWCPCGDNTAEALHGTYPNLVTLAYHGPAGSASDPWTTYNGNNILALLGMSAYPTATFDRQNTPGDYTTWSGFCTDRYTNYGPTPISIAVTNQQYDPGTRVLTMTLGITSNANLPSQYKVNYAITEDNIVYAQTGNSTCPGSTTWVHKWVVRNMVNGATGEAVNSGAWTAGQTISKTFSTTLNAAWVAANCRINLFVYKDNVALGAAEIQNAISRGVLETGVSTEKPGIPVEFELSQNYPNPFNPSTNIKLAVAREGFVTLKVFDVTGQEVLTGVNENLKPGYYNVEIDGSKLSSGIYFYTVRANGFSTTKKMTLVK